MKLWRPRFSIRVLLACMLVLGVGLGMLGRQLVLTRMEAARQRQLISELTEHNVDLTFERKRSKQSFIESFVARLDGKQPDPRVNQVTLRNGSRSKDDLEKIVALQGLQHFVDEDGRGTLDGLKPLGECPELKTVMVMQLSPHAAKTAHELFEGKAPLETVVLGTWPVEDECLRAAANHRTLQDFYFHGRNVTNEGVGALRASRSLRTLRIGFGKNLGEGLRKLADSPSLDDLRLQDYRFGDGDLEALAGLDRIHSISIESKEFPVGILSAVLDCENVEKISLIGPFSADASDNNVSCSELKSFSAHGTVDNLRELIRRLAVLKKFRTLMLPKNDLSKEELALLSKIPSLKTLRIGPGSSLDGVELLKTELPECNVTIVGLDDAPGAVPRKKKPKPSNQTENQPPKEANTP